MRAGKVIIGETLVIEAVRSKKGKLVLLANDTGVNTCKKITNKARFYRIELIDLFTSNELSKALGKSCKVLAISDKAFSEKLINLSQ
jgi:ribosomal protein L7Ae-like RNA K-turn-binding protein